MVKLTEALVLAMSRATELENVRKFNCWGSDLTDVRIIRRMPNVEVLSLSVNKISTLSDVIHCKNLEELYIRKNDIRDLNELYHLKSLSKLRILWLADNPCATEPTYRMTVLKHLPNLQKLDNIAVEEEEVNNAIEAGEDLMPPALPTESLDLRPARDPAMSVTPSGGPGSRPSIVSTSLPAFSLQHKAGTDADGQKNGVDANKQKAGTEPPPLEAVTELTEQDDDTGQKPPEVVDDQKDGSGSSSNGHVSGPQEAEEAASAPPCTESVPDIAGSSQDAARSSQEGEKDAEEQNPETLSWEETNNIRVQLGLKPLPVEKVMSLKPRGSSHSAKTRNANILQAALHLIKELDSENLEILADAVRNRLEVL